VLGHWLLASSLAQVSSVLKKKDIEQILKVLEADLEKPKLSPESESPVVPEPFNTIHSRKDSN
jgi:hypothetical protein